MKTRSVIIKVAAEVDVRNIARYIARDSPRSAERFGIEFDDAVDRIRAFAELGNRIGDIRPALHFIRVSPRFWRYLIVYRIEGEYVRVGRVLHRAMNIQAQIAKSDFS